jgi:hypothetical protein
MSKFEVTKIPTQTGLALVVIDEAEGLDAIVSGDGRVTVVRHGGPAIEAEEFSPRPDGYCPHGTYVGGCGIDWICGACELGDDDWSLEDEAAATVRKATRHVLRHVGFLTDFGYELSQVNDNLRTQLVADVTQDGRRALDELRIIAAGRRFEARYGRDRYAVEGFATDCYRQWEHLDGNAKGHYPYSELDEIHEYGYVPD